MKIKITRFRVFSALAIAILAGASIFSYVLANSPATVTDNFSDSTKIASSAQVTVASGVVTLSAASTFSCGSSLVDSRDGKTYATVTIGTQCWMAQNLNIGTRVAGSATQTKTCAASDGSDIQKYCYSDLDSNCTRNTTTHTDGGLYQWDQAMCNSTTAGAQGICPTGWHVPTHDELTTMERAVCVAGGTASATCDTTFPINVITTGWLGTAANEGTRLKNGGSTGFNGLLSGYRFTDGTFSNLTATMYFWSSVQSTSNAWRRGLDSSYATVYRYTSSKALGFSVRCLKN